MRHHLPTLLAVTAILASAVAAAQPAVRPARSIKPPPTAATIGRTTPSPAIIVQGGISPDAPCDARPGSAAELSAGASGAIAIGPKQDDPVGPRPSPTRDAASATASGRGQLAIGPKQDDPVGPKPTTEAGAAMPASHGALAIGPKQDDPSPPPTTGLARCTPAAH
jgi:hypothetical protein